MHHIRTRVELVPHRLAIAGGGEAGAAAKHLHSSRARVMLADAPPAMLVDALHRLRMRMHHTACGHSGQPLRQNG